MAQDERCDILKMKKTTPSNIAQVVVIGKSKSKSNLASMLLAMHAIHDLIYQFQSEKPLRTSLLQ